MTTPQKVTVICMYCKNLINGYFKNDNKDIVDIGTNQVVGVVGEYKKKKGYIHLPCKVGMEAESNLNPGYIAPPIH